VSERKPSERWRFQGGTRWVLPFSDYCFAYAFGEAPDFEWQIFFHGQVADGGVEDRLADAQLAAEDALLEIAREIREAVGRG